MGPKLRSHTRAVTSWTCFPLEVRQQIIAEVIQATVAEAIREIVSVITILLLRDTGIDADEMIKRVIQAPPRRSLLYLARVSHGFGLDCITPLELAIKPFAYDVTLNLRLQRKIAEGVYTGKDWLEWHSIAFHYPIANKHEEMLSTPLQILKLRELDQGIREIWVGKASNLRT